MLVEVRFIDDGVCLVGEWRVPDFPGPWPALVFLHGSGPATRDDWREEAERFATAGIATLAYDKSGVGDSEGDWTSQSFDDRAREALSAVRFVKEVGGVAIRCVGLLGASQGGWIAPMAAAASTDVAFVVTISASGVSPRDQDLFRLERQLRRSGIGEPGVGAALAAWRQADEDLTRELAPAVIAKRQHAFRKYPWYSYMIFDDPVIIGFVQRIWSFDPVPYLERCSCPLLAVWGSEDDLGPVVPSREIFERALPRAGNTSASLRVFPGADHGLRSLADGQEVPGLIELFAEWIKGPTNEGDDAQG